MVWREGGKGWYGEGGKGWYGEKGVRGGIERRG